MLLGLALGDGALAADVFVSPGPDGSLRYATQPLDASYRLAYREASSPLGAAGPAPASPAAAARELVIVISRVARRHDLPPALVQAVASVESGLDPSAVSPKGARGAMQLMPAVAARYGLGAPDAWRDAERNIDAGARHLKDLLARYQGNVPLALAAYNAGAGAVGRHRGRIPPYRETMLYVPAVLARTVTLTAE